MCVVLNRKLGKVHPFSISNLKFVGQVIFLCVSFFVAAGGTSEGIFAYEIRV